MIALEYKWSFRHSGLARNYQKWKVVILYHLW